VVKRRGDRFRSRTASISSPLQKLPYRLSHKGGIPNYYAFMIDDEHIYDAVIRHSNRSVRYELTRTASRVTVK